MEPPAPQAGPAPGARRSGAVDLLFRDEMEQAVRRLNWHGERLSDDTVYAVALTGTSWELAWGKEHLFSLAWGNSHAVLTLSNGRNYRSAVDEIQSNYDQRDYQGAVRLALANFSVDEIACDPRLKEAIGTSLLALGRPEQAFPIFSAPFEPSPLAADTAFANRKFREQALAAAKRAGLLRETIAFALSLLLEPGDGPAALDSPAQDYLTAAGVDIDRVLLGILEAPPKLRGLPAYTYAAADLLAMRAVPRLLPYLLHLAGSDDVYLRGRALEGLGIVGYQPRAADPPGWMSKVALWPLREYVISASERQMITKAVLAGAGSDRYRVRAGAAFALSLLGDDASVKDLQKLGKDRAYLLASSGSAAGVRRLLFPVRMAAEIGLERFGLKPEFTGGDLKSRELERLRRGGQDETNDRRNIRRDVVSQIAVTPIDIALAIPDGKETME